MATKTRIANKTQWALQDILAELNQARRAMRALQERNEQKLMDPLVAMHLQRLSEALARLEVTTIRAQHGEYGNEAIDGSAARNI